MGDIATSNWQDWRAQLARGLSAEGWLALAEAMDSASAKDGLQRMHVTLINLWFNRMLANTFLLIALELPEEQALAEIEAVARQARQAQFERSPKAVPRRLRDMYRDSTTSIRRFLPDAADLLGSVFTRYLRGEHDLQGDANVLVRACQRALAERDRAAALDAIGRAGAAGLRGARLWPGWLNEGQPEFRQWLLTLTTALEEWGHFLPLGPAAEARLRAADIAGGLPRPRMGGVQAVGEAEDAVAATADEPGRAVAPDEEMSREWIELVERGQSLSDEEIQAMGDRYGALADLAIMAVQLGGEDSPHGTRNLGVVSLGILRCAKPAAINLLIEVIAAPESYADSGQDEGEDPYEFDIVEDAVQALQKIGAPALPAVMDFLRYSAHAEARRDMLDVLGVAGRGSEEAYQHLAGEFANTAWINGKSDLAGPLAQLHDPRAVPLIVEALRAPELGDEDAWHLLDALQELEVPLYVNRGTRSVNIPDYGIIADVLPVDWMSRQELDAEAEEHDQGEFEDDDDDDDEEDEDDLLDGDDYGDVIYDPQGIPRCPDCGAEMYYEAGEWRHVDDKPASVPKIGRNDPCPCGSGKKYKHCHGKGQ
jgi:hypothetical protein